MKQESPKLSTEAQVVLREFEKRSGLEGVEYDLRQNLVGEVLILRMANPTERYFGVLEDVLAIVSGDERPTCTIRKRTPANRLQSPEARYLLRTLAESLTISRHSFKEDFFARYTKSVSNAESQVTALANHIVFGRRGAGKSSLLLYAMRLRDDDGLPSAWVNMQIYEKRQDAKVVVEVILELLDQLKDVLSVSPGYSTTLQRLQVLRNDESLNDDKIRQSLPEVGKLFAAAHGRNSSIFLFLDDFHVLDISMQPRLLGFLYSITRGKNVFLKLSAIETLTKAWDPTQRTGMQVPHDAQTVRLDYNLTMPDKAATHIEGILNAHAIYCGLPSIRFLCTSADAISRLVWVSAGVPRDALNMFAQAMTKGASMGRSRVSVSNVNMAASEMVSQKMRELEIDVPTPDAEEDLGVALDRVKDFCITKKRKNAFLVEIRNGSPLYHNILKLVDLRLVHVISEGITVGKAGRKYLGLILDYGFYTGVRAAQSVDLFNKQTERVAYKDLRRLPVMLD